jgi:type I restriction enzyme S subunit
VSWKTSKLKYLCVDSGQYGLNISAQDYAPTGRRLIRTSDIDANGRLRSDDEGVHVDVPLEPRHEVRAGDLLLSRSGTIGRGMLVGTPAAPATFAGYLVRFRPRPDVDPRFLAYVAASSGFQAAVAADAVASTIQNFNAERYANILVAAPPLDEQRRIADFLDVETARLDALVAARESQAARLTELWEASLGDQVSRLIAEYGTVPLRRIVRGVEQGWSPQCDDVPADPAEWAVLRTSAVSSGIFDPLCHKKLPDTFEANPRWRIEDGDVLMTRGSGSAHHVGVAALARTEGRRLLLSDLLYRVRLGAGWSPEFVVWALNSRPVRDLVSSLLRGQYGQTIKLRAGDVRSIQMPNAPFVEQERTLAWLSARYTEIQKLIDSVGGSLALMGERRQALITAAVTGQGLPSSE